MNELKYINMPVISYCDIPEEIAELELADYSNNCYVEYHVVSLKSQIEMECYLHLPSWIIENYPELEGRNVLIYMDY